MQTTNDTRNSVKEKPKAISGCEGDGADPTCSGGEVSDEWQRCGRGVAGLLAAAAGSGRAVARSGVASRAGQGRGAQRRRWPSRAGAGCAGAELGSHRQRRGAQGRSRAGAGRAGAGRAATSLAA
ncbi:hypothetical protein Syun_027399 [Stephania yunnanensis]|uniref:Uncharacterized protein n=1 Tax=Stephania yunnanensis TaxID=152371 RepID=A0AAP0HL07_9MAGN